MNEGGKWIYTIIGCSFVPFDLLVCNIWQSYISTFPVLVLPVTLPQRGTSPPSNPFTLQSTLYAVGVESPGRLIE